PAGAREGCSDDLLVAADGGEQLVGDRVDDGARRRAGDRVPAERARVVTRLECAGRLVGNEQAANRQTVCEAFGERDAVGPHAEVLEAEERPRSPDARLYLVEDE